MRPKTEWREPPPEKKTGCGTTLLFHMKLTLHLAVRVKHLTIDGFDLCFHDLLLAALCDGLGGLKLSEWHDKEDTMLLTILISVSLSTSDFCTSTEKENQFQISSTTYKFYVNS